MYITIITYIRNPLNTSKGKITTGKLNPGNNYDEDLDYKHKKNLQPDVTL
jgi:hypothetical protein